MKALQKKSTLQSYWGKNKKAPTNSQASSKPSKALSGVPEPEAPRRFYSKPFNHPENRQLGLLWVCALGLRVLGLGLGLRFRV